MKFTMESEVFKLVNIYEDYKLLACDSIIASWTVILTAVVQHWPWPPQSWGF